MSKCNVCGYDDNGTGDLAHVCKNPSVVVIKENEAFIRETRYKVVKLSTGKEVEAVVVEKDWPEYETVWQMLENRFTGKAAKADSAHEIERLKAHINDMREALEENHYSNSTDKAIKLYEKAIAQTPAQSLQAFENDVIEKCAQVADTILDDKESFIGSQIRTLKKEVK